LKLEVVGSGGYGLEPLLFNLVMEYVMRKVTVDRNTTLQNKLILIDTQIVFA
jgi:hypothetical protein